MVMEEFELLKSIPNIYSRITFHRMEIELSEQTKNEELKKRKFMRMKRLARELTSVFTSKYHTKELNSQLDNFGVTVRNDELMAALISLAN